MTAGSAVCRAMPLVAAIAGIVEVITLYLPWHRVAMWSWCFGGVHECGGPRLTTTVTCTGLTHTSAGVVPWTVLGVAAGLATTIFLAQHRIAWRLGGVAILGTIVASVVADGIGFEVPHILDKVERLPAASINAIAALVMLVAAIVTICAPPNPRVKDRHPSVDARRTRSA